MNASDYTGPLAFQLYQPHRGQPMSHERTVRIDQYYQLAGHRYVQLCLRGQVELATATDVTMLRQWLLRASANLLPNQGEIPEPPRYTLAHIGGPCFRMSGLLCLPSDFLGLADELSLLVAEKGVIPGYGH